MIAALAAVCFVQTVVLIYVLREQAAERGRLLHALMLTSANPAATAFAPAAKKSSPSPALPPEPVPYGL